MHPALDAEGGANATELDPVHAITLIRKAGACRFGDRQAVACFRYDCNQRAHSIGLLRALAHPIVDPRQIQASASARCAGQSD